MCRQLVLLAGLVALLAAGEACGGSSSPASPVTYPPLTVQPQTVTLSANQLMCFTATGGDAPYTWTLSTNSGNGVLTPQGAQACFQANGYATFVITVSSGDGQSATTSGIVLP
jgi:hypothetical protein